MSIPITNSIVPSYEEVYQSLRRSLQRTNGFGLIFVQCPPVEADRIIKQIHKELPQKQLGNLILTDAISNFYNLVEIRPDRDNLNILFVRGLEKSLEPYIEPGYGGEGNYYNMNTVPDILNHFNRQRELFRDHFKNICFVFMLPAFAIKYMIRRSPDFFDWGTGFFDFSSEVRISGDRSVSIGGNIVRDDTVTGDKYLKAKIIGDLVASGISFPAYHFERLLHSFDIAIQEFSQKEPGGVNAILTSKLRIDQGNLLKKLGRFEEAIKSYDLSIEVDPSSHTAWFERGDALGQLGHIPEAIKNYDRALEINPQLQEAFYNRSSLYSRIGDENLALQDLRQAIELGGDEVREWAKINPAFVELRQNPRFQEMIGTIEDKEEQRG